MSPFLRMLHVAPRLRGGWEVRYTGSQKPLRIWHLKRYAEQFARDRRVAAHDPRRPFLNAEAIVRRAVEAAIALDSGCGPPVRIEWTSEWPAAVE